MAGCFSWPEESTSNRRTVMQTSQTAHPEFIRGGLSRSGSIASASDAIVA